MHERILTSNLRLTTAEILETQRVADHRARVSWYEVVLNRLLALHDLLLDSVKISGIPRLSLVLLDQINSGHRLINHLKGELRFLLTQCSKVIDHRQLLVMTGFKLLDPGLELLVALRHSRVDCCRALLVLTGPVLRQILDLLLSLLELGL